MAFKRQPGRQRIFYKILCLIKMDETTTTTKKRLDLMYIVQENLNNQILALAGDNLTHQKEIFLLKKCLRAQQVELEQSREACKKCKEECKKLQANFDQYQKQHEEQELHQLQLQPFDNNNPQIVQILQHQDKMRQEFEQQQVINNFGVNFELETLKVDLETLKVEMEKFKNEFNDLKLLLQTKIVF